jgi:hypothetical protein
MQQILAINTIKVSQSNVRILFRYVILNALAAQRKSQQKTMTLFHKIQKPADFIFDYLTDMQKYTSVHPVITRIDKTAPDTYLVYETLKVGFIPFRFTYPAIVESSPAEKLVVMRATVMKITRIEMRFLLKSESDFTVIEENIVFNSPLPVKSMMQNIFRKQHQQLFKNIEMQKG